MTQLSAQEIRGIVPAIPTLVTSAGEIDVSANSKLLRYLMEQGIDGVLPIGGTGEYGALAREQRIAMVRHCAETCAGRVPVIPGVLDPGFNDAFDAGKAFADAGASALLVLTPYYTNPTQAGVRDYFLRYADKSPLPILLYEIPSRTRIAIAPEVIHELSRHERIIGMKACNNDMYHFLQVIAGVSDAFSVMSGEDTLFPLQVAAGAKGGIIVTASLIPQVWQQMLKLAGSGQLDEALALHRELIPMINLIFAETNPGPMKAVMDLIGVNAPTLLPPLVASNADLVAKLRVALQPLLQRTF